ncbi:helix-turn-helix domain-containing protein [Microbacterium sp.]|uniref:helix-turn-helix domain-containing protein n=1 Tax=Microbacterium sp. TaxID=51671 RepID=UPI003A9293D8
MTKRAFESDAVQQMVADEVRAEMARQRKTAAELAIAIGVTQHTVGRRLNGSTPFNIFELARVAECFGLTTDVIVSRALQRPTTRMAVAS